MVLVSEFCAQFLSCPIKSLRDRLNHPEDRVQVLQQLFGKKVQTTYKDRNGMRKCFFIGGMTERGAAFQPAYGHLRKPFNINVAAHFYARHRVKLHYPYMPCIIEGFNRGEDRYYPMELLEIVDDKKGGRLFGRLFTEIEEQGEEDNKSEGSHSSNSSYLQFNGKGCKWYESVDDVDNTGRGECSQPSSSAYTYW
ncbi:hypothetical protein niasHT_030978 [Heterodera trifolii]|uniref:PAZ domain-containing protein n=1 Tax=Heterodera trifolii TaxID=157864 RepID=A0ABD2I9D6_9BILA